LASVRVFLGRKVDHRSACRGISPPSPPTFRPVVTHAGSRFAWKLHRRTDATAVPTLPSKGTTPPGAVRLSLRRAQLLAAGQVKAWVNQQLSNRENLGRDCRACHKPTAPSRGLGTLVPREDAIQ